MIASMIVELLIGIFALAGFVCVIQWIARRLFGSRYTMLAIEILTQRDAKSAEVLLRDALCSVLGLPSGRLVVLTTKELAEEHGLLALFARYGVSCYFVQKKETEEAPKINEIKQ